jgi:nucleotide sugar dehydrogenase
VALADGLQVTSAPELLAGSSTFVICVPTPLSATGAPDTGFISSAVQTIAPYVDRGTLVVLESTSYPGTTEEVVAGPLGELTGLRPGIDFCVAFSPERIDPGNADYQLANTPKIVAGLHQCCADRAAALYESVSESVVRASGLREAELAKLLENTYRQVNIALMNEMVKFCRALDIDLYEAIRCASTKPFGFQAFYPGPGVGGHCIPIDPKYLAARVESRLGYAFRFVELAQEINDGMPAYVVARLRDELGARDVGISAARVLLLGVTYKRDVPDLRESPSEGIVRELRLAGAEVEYVDPFVDSWSVDGHPVRKASLSDSGGRQFAATILVQDHAHFAGLDLEALAPLCLDTRGARTGEFVVRL